MRRRYERQTNVWCRETGREASPAIPLASGGGQRPPVQKNAVRRGSIAGIRPEIENAFVFNGPGMARNGPEPVRNWSVHRHGPGAPGRSGKELARGLAILGDLGGERVEAVELHLGADELEQLHAYRLAVEVAGKVEQMHL